MKKTFLDDIFESFNLDAVFDDAWKGFETKFKYPTTNAKHYHDSETKEHTLIIQAAGFKKEEIDIEVTNKGIILKGDIKDESLKERISRNEFHYILHNNDVDAESLDAALENGILTIKFKTLTEKTTKKVVIK